MPTSYVFTKRLYVYQVKPGARHVYCEGPVKDNIWAWWLGKPLYCLVVHYKVRDAD